MNRARTRSPWRRAIWIGPAVFALAVLGPGRPLVLTAVHNASAPIAPISDDRTQRGPTEHGGMWSVTVDLNDEVWQPPLHISNQTPSASKRHALIIGINHARGGKPLPGSVTDANNLRDALLMYGFKRENITMLREAEATREAIRAGLTSLAQRTPSNGVAVFAVATHTRRYQGRNELLTADGLRISSGELASRLGDVRSKMWVALPTCYSAGYALPGIVGKNRIATFASAADKPSYQLGEAGSFLILNMVRKAMIEKQAPGSVEESFHWAKNTLKDSSPENVPSMSDGISGDLVLGHVPNARDPADDQPSVGWSYEAGRPHQDPSTRRPDGDVQAAPQEPEPEADPGADGGSSRGRVGICGTFRARCDH